MSRTITAGTLSFLVLAILAGLVGIYAIQALTAKKPPPEQEAPTPPAPVSVPLASVELPKGRVIGLGDISLVAMSREQLKERFDNLQLVMLSPEQIIGRVVRADIAQGEPFLTTSMFLEGSGPDISELLKPGYRAVSLPFPEMRANLVDSGDFVDILFRATPREAKGDQLAIPETTVNLLQAVEVIAAEYPRKLAPDDDSDLPPAQVTFAVSAEQAQILQTVQGRGDLSLIPRAPNEPLATRAGKETTLESLLNIQPPKPKPVPKPPEVALLYATEMYKGTTRTLNVFREQGKPAANTRERDLPTFDPEILKDLEKPDPNNRPNVDQGTPKSGDEGKSPKGQPDANKPDANKKNGDAKKNGGNSPKKATNSAAKKNVAGR